MNLISIDNEKCCRDGICVAVCPLKLIAPDSEGIPRVLPSMGSYCIGCGHCVAACPRGALDNAKNPLAENLEIPAGSAFTPLQAELMLRSRRSVRCFRDELVPRDTMRKLLEIARFAPSAHNSQGISYLVVEGRKHLDAVREIVIEWMREAGKASGELAKRFHTLIRCHEKGEDRLLRGAPQIIVAHAPSELQPATASTVLCLEYVELYAPSLGVSTCWAGYAQACARQSPALGRFLRIPEDRSITGILMAGYPKYRYYRLPTRNPLNATWFEDGEL